MPSLKPLKKKVWKKIKACSILLLPILHIFLCFLFMIGVEHFSFCDLLLKTHPNIAALHISLLLSAWLIHSFCHSIIQQNYIEHLPSIKPCSRCKMNKSSNAPLFFSLQTLFILEPLFPHLPYLYLLSYIGQWFASRFSALQMCYFTWKCQAFLL